MKLFLYILLIFQITSGPLEEAQSLFEAQKYNAAIAKYRVALSLYPSQRHEIFFNIGQCYMEMDSSQQALGAFYQAISAGNSQISSMAYNQLGILFAQNKQYEQALVNLKKAVQTHSLNLDATYNYELVRRLMEVENEANRSQKQEKQEKSSEKPEEGEGEEENSEDEGEGEESEQEEQQEKQSQQAPKPLQQAQQAAHNDQAQPFRADTLDLKRAQQLLDRMRENEMRFMQELRKKTKQAAKTGKPNW